MINSHPQWVPGKASAAMADVPRKILGGPVIKRRMQVWHGVISRTVTGTGPQGRPHQVIERCFHNHTKRSVADECGRLAAGRLNRLARQPDHDVWPAESSPIRGQLGPIRHRLYWDGKVSERSYPLSARCQPCGCIIFLSHPDGDWEHAEAPEDAPPSYEHKMTLPCGCPIDADCTGYHPGALP